MKNILWIVLGLLLFLAVSCKEKRVQAIAPETQQIAEADTIPLKKLIFENVKDSTVYFTTDFEIDYPSGISQSALRDSIIRFLFRRITGVDTHHRLDTISAKKYLCKESLDSITRVFSTWEPDSSDFEEDKPLMSVEYSFVKVDETDNFITYHLWIYNSYHARGLELSKSYESEFYTFRKSDSHIMTWNDIFKKGKASRHLVNKLWNDSLNHLDGEDIHTDYSKEDYFEDYTHFAPAIFKDGILVYYHGGATTQNTWYEFTFPYNALHSVLKPGIK